MMTAQKAIKRIARVFWLLVMILPVSPLPGMGWEYLGNVSLQGVLYLKDRAKERRNEQSFWHLDLSLKQNLDKTDVETGSLL